MDLYEIMRTTFSAREYTEEPLLDKTLYKILDNARFAPSGGNRQGWKVIIIRKRESKEKIAELAIPAAKRYAAQQQAGENPWNTIDSSKVSKEAIESTPPSPKLGITYTDAPVVLIVCVDLKVVAAMDQHLDRVGLVSGASIYPFVWNILLAARNEGYGGRITTIPISQEPELQEYFNIPDYFAIAAIIPLGKPMNAISKLKRKPVTDFTVLEYWNGKPLTER
jgi:nitroreductase